MKSDSTTAVNARFVTGPAGSGKTTLLKDRDNTLLCATTGIAAVNLGTRTLASTLKFYDTPSLQRETDNGHLAKRLTTISTQVCELAIDEASMLDATQLDILVDAIAEHNEDQPQQSLSITLVGDFAQLPPINAPWAFTAKCWPQFQIERLTKIWRQDDPTFLHALNLARAGDGSAAAQALKESGVTFASTLDNSFQGTTIVGTNAEVEAINSSQYARLNGSEFTIRATIKGESATEWQYIPERLSLKPGAKVMVLANSADGIYVNGDLGTVTDQWNDGVLVRLFRTGTIELVTRVCRRFETVGDPAPGVSEREYDPEFASDYDFPYWHRGRERLVRGSITYVPLRLAYATTAHKSQGLTLDAVQIDPSHRFFGYPNLAYVALSRCRTPIGLRIVGTTEALAKQIRLAPEVKKWI